jgi:hypothetical protein
MRAEELTFEQEQSRDEQYMNALRVVPRPNGVNDLERFALDYRRVFCQRYPHMVEIFASVGLNVVGDIG